ncbi:hypothetical protein A628_04015 [Salmonella enterica subsp. enterica serovar Cubana str. 76814]|uniref:Uncharacterized protein n=1 Tax=Salmonella enterica subsp. enterica serovar Cubana str. 76814 TaxID=1192560 RepID=V7IL07_SALET|nr:hypothetical protein A628_04015 [Salmonella enterica subsp. enterica serovar Cubana str. 76814]
MQSCRAFSLYIKNINIGMIFVIAYLTKPGKRRAAGQCHLYGERLCWNYFLCLAFF